jgi:hypothetical protein
MHYSDKYAESWELALSTMKSGGIDALRLLPDNVITDARNHWLVIEADANNIMPRVPAGTMVSREYWRRRNRTT